MLVNRNRAASLLSAFAGTVDQTASSRQVLTLGTAFSESAAGWLLLAAIGIICGWALMLKEQVTGSWTPPRARRMGTRGLVGNVAVVWNFTSVDVGSTVTKELICFWTGCHL